MKKFLILMLLFATANSTVVNAQKIGRVLFQEIVFVLPETDSAQVKIQKHAQTLEQQVEQMQVEFNNKLDDYQKNKANYSAAIDQQKQRELQELSARSQEFVQTATKEVEDIQVALTQPIFLKVSEMVKTVSKEQGLTMVVDLSQGNNIMYIDEDNTIDITPIVKERLGVARDAMPKVAAAPQQ